MPNPENCLSRQQATVNDRHQTRSSTTPPGYNSLTRGSTRVSSCPLGCHFHAEFTRIRRTCPAGSQEEVKPDSLWNAIQQAQRLLRERSGPRTREHDSGKIERIGGSDLQSFSGLGSAP